MSGEKGNDFLDNWNTFMNSLKMDMDEYRSMIFGQRIDSLLCKNKLNCIEKKYYEYYENVSPGLTIEQKLIISSFINDNIDMCHESFHLKYEKQENSFSNVGNMSKLNKKQLKGEEKDFKELDKCPPYNKRVVRAVNF